MLFLKKERFIHIKSKVAIYRKHDEENQRPLSSETLGVVIKIFVDIIFLQNISPLPINKMGSF